MNGYNFTEDTREALARARGEAKRLQHEYVGTEHILLGLIGEETGTAAIVLTNLQITPADVIRQLEEIVRKGRGGAHAGDLPYTSRAKKVLELAMAAARSLDHLYVGTEHLLLGLLAERQCIAAQLLVDLGVTPEIARDEILRVLGEPAHDGKRWEAFRTEPASRNPMTSGLSGVGYNFTERVRKVLALARQESSRLAHEYIGTEHILLGLIREGEGVGASALRNLKVSTEAIVQRLETTVKKGRGDPSGPDIPYTSRAKKVLELAMAQSRTLGHSYVGTEHLLLGLLAEERGIAAQLLGDVGVTLENVRAEVLRILETAPN